MSKSDKKTPKRLNAPKRLGRSVALAAASLALTVPMVSVLALEAAAQERPGAEKGNGGGAGERGNASRGGGETGAQEERGNREGSEKSGQAAEKSGAHKDAKPEDKKAEDKKAEDKKTGEAKSGDQQGRRDEAGKETNKSSSESRAEGDKDHKDATKDQARDDKAKGGADKTRAEDGKSRPDRGKAAAEGDRDKDRGDRDRATSTQNLDERTRKEADRKIGEVREKVTQNERDRVREAFSRTGVQRARDIDVRVDIGIALPRTVALYDVPPDIVEIVPVYRGYRYVEVDDDICIVDPDTFVVIDVIHRGGGHASTGASGGEYGRGVRLELTSGQEAYIREHIDRSHEIDRDMHLSIGAGIPPDLELYRFPDEVVREVPAVREFRYVVVDQNVIIVDPGPKNVVYKIDD